MTIRKYRRDPRSSAEKQGDAEILARFERGEVLQVPASVEQAAIRYVRQKHQEGRALAARLGQELGKRRRLLGVTQEQVAQATGTHTPNISRIESGRYGGLTIEGLFAIMEALRSASGRSALEPLSNALQHANCPSVHEPVHDHFHHLAKCLEG